MESPYLRNHRGFTLIELLAVMAIVAVLAGIIAIAVGGSGETSRDTQIQQDSTTVDTAAGDFFAAQEGAEVLTPQTVLSFGVTGTQIKSSRWPEDYIKTVYPDVFTTQVTGTVNSISFLTVTENAASTTVFPIKKLLENFNAIDFDALENGDFMASRPDGADTLSAEQYHNYLWLFEKTTAAGGSSEGAARQVAVLKLVSVQEIEGSSRVDLTFTQLVGEAIE